MVNVAGRESTGAVACVPRLGIFLPLLPAAGACSEERNRTCEAVNLIRPGATMPGPAGLATLIANRANIVDKRRSSNVAPCRCGLGVEGRGELIRRRRSGRIELGPRLLYSRTKGKAKRQSIGRGWKLCPVFSAVGRDSMSRSGRIGSKKTNLEIQGNSASRSSRDVGLSELDMEERLRRKDTVT